MADTIPNIIVPAETVVDIYADAGVIAAGISAGDKIRVKMIGGGEAKLYAGATLTGEPTNAEGFYPIYGREDRINDLGDAGAFIWSDHGCTINIEVA